MTAASAGRALVAGAAPGGHDRRMASRSCRSDSDATTGLDRGRSARPRQRGELRSRFRMREALETPGKRAVLITTSRFLGRRVAAELLTLGHPRRRQRRGPAGPVATRHLPAADGASGGWRRGAGGPARSPEASIGQRRDRAGSVPALRARAGSRPAAGATPRRRAGRAGVEPCAGSIRTQGGQRRCAPAELLPWLERLADAARPFAEPCWRKAIGTPARPAPGPSRLRRVAGGRRAGRCRRALGAGRRCASARVRQRARR